MWTSPKQNKQLQEFRKRSKTEKQQTGQQCNRTVQKRQMFDEEYSTKSDYN